MQLAKYMNSPVDYVLPVLNLSGSVPIICFNCSLNHQTCTIVQLLYLGSYGNIPSSRDLLCMSSQKEEHGKKWRVRLFPLRFRASSHTRRSSVHMELQDTFRIYPKKGVFGLERQHIIWKQRRQRMRFKTIPWWLQQSHYGLCILELMLR